MAAPVLWFYGLSGSGKTTVTNFVYEYLKERYSHVIILDADVLRHNYWPEVGLSKDARLENTRRITRLAKTYYDIDVPVLIAACAPFQQQREEALAILPGIKFVFMNTPLSVCQARKPFLYRDDNPNKIIMVDPLPPPWAVINGDQDIKTVTDNIL
jgi:adenylylsulfate kinase-like enzyme